jgi:hypothetical protein
MSSGISGVFTRKNKMVFGCESKKDSRDHSKCGKSVVLKNLCAENTLWRKHTRESFPNRFWSDSISYCSERLTFIY